MSTPRQQSRALRFMELGLALALLGTVIVVILHRAVDLQARIEAHAVRADINAMRTAVTLTWLRDSDQVQPGMNPLDLLERPGMAANSEPQPDADNLGAPGQWEYDAGEGIARYRPARHRAFPELNASSQPFIQVRVAVKPAGPRLRVKPPLQD